MDAPEIHRASDAWKLLADSRFLSEWRRLYDACPWATAYQSAPWVVTWYESYRSRFSPVLVVEWRGDRLHGLLTLAESADGDALVVAGAHQAEYHVWLSESESGARFGARALSATVAAFPGRDLRFEFLPPELSRAEAEAVLDVPGAELRERKRPLMRIDEAELNDSFKKKSNKSRFNRLKALGPVEFARITDPAALDRVFDEIIEMYDFRQAAAHGAFPFRDDPLKKPFHRALLARDPQLLHLTIMTVGGRPVAAHFGVVGKGRVHLAIITYAPVHARHSPGKLHIMQLGMLLAREGIRELDLTPGDDPWKDRFATGHDRVHQLVIHRNAAVRAGRTARLRLGALARDGLRPLGITPDVARKLFKRAARLTPGKATRLVRRFAREHAELRIYERDAAVPVPPSALPDAPRRDSLTDLLKYEPSASGDASVGDFLGEALDRLENGEHVYTYATADRLLHWGWLIEQQDEATLTEIGQRYRYPPGTAVLYDFNTTPAARGRGLYQSSLIAMLRDVAALSAAQHAYIVVLADNAPSRRVIEKLGFVHQASLFRSRTMGRSRVWRVPELAGVAPVEPAPPVEP